MHQPSPSPPPAQRTVATLAELDALALELAAMLRPGDVVALSGPLGSGKTALVRAFVRILHGRDEASSPTFTFWHRYAGQPLIDHLDLYRVEDPSELADLGLDEAFGGTSIVFVEWWEHAPDVLPAHALFIDISGAGDAPRRVVIERR